MVRITLESLVKRFDQVAVLDRTSLEVEPGALVVIVGPSGCGKTTLSRVISGVASLDEGEIYFDQNAVHNVSPEARRVGLVLEDDRLWPHLTVEQIVGYALKVRKYRSRDRQARVAELVGQVGIDSIVKRRPHELGRMERLRVALARALSHDPQVVVLDSPLERLEPREREVARGLIQRVHRESATTFMVTTSEPSEALSLADRIAIMDLGRIVQSGTPEQVYREPVDTFVARFLGEVNLVQAQVESCRILPTRVEAILRTPLGRLISHNVGSALDPGKNVTVVIRPEAVKLSPNTQSQINRIPASLESMSFRGAWHALRFRGQGRWPLLACCAQDEASQLQIGLSMILSIAPENVVPIQINYQAE